MSSEGSVSSETGSRIRQFGLYRSIDARTEDFLRLSRRKQIKQGCVCAAVSTAITVTVVIVVILVYEFSLNSNVNIDSSLRTKWFSLTNDTTEDGFQPKYTKSSFDKTTLTLLPILLKALKKNVFLEKLIEDQANTSPINERSETTEYSLDKNVFSRNWLRMPSSKIYSIEYKTSPISYYKSPSKKVEYFTKIRKIRDYQRIVQYVDKMISEKVYIGSTKPMVADMLTEEEPSAKPQPRVKTQLKYKKKVVSPKSEVKQINTDNNKTVNNKENSCRCSMKFGEILYKILSGIQALLSVESEKKQKPSICDYKLNSKSDEISLTFTEMPKIESDKIIEPTSETKIENNIYYNKQENGITFIKDRIETKNTRKPYKNIIDYETDLVQSTTINSNVNATNEIETTEPSTKSMKSNKLSKKGFDQTSEQNILQNSNQKFHKSIYGQVTDEDDEYSATTVARNDLFYNNQLNIFKNKMFMQLKNLRHETVNNSIVSNSVPDNISEIYTEKITRNKNILLDNLNRTVYQVIENDNNIQTNTKPTIVSTSTSKTSSKYPIIKTSTYTKLLNKMIYDNKPKKVSTAVEEESETLNNLTQEDVFKQVDFSEEHPVEKNGSVENKQALWEELKTENIPAWKTMLSNNRPVYLNIQKNSWKRDEPQQDYDMNFINNYDQIDL